MTRHTLYVASDGGIVCVRLETVEILWIVNSTAKADYNGDGDLDLKITLSDITRLIDCVYVSKATPAACL